VAYVKTNWVDDVTPLSATNMNNIEDGLINTNNIEEGLVNIRHQVAALEVLTGNPQPTTWLEVQQLSRDGKGEEYFEVGDQFMVDYNGSPQLCDIIAINQDTPSDTLYPYSITIQFHDVLLNAMIDAPEPSNPNTTRETYGNNRYIHSGIKQWLNSSDTTFNWVSQHAYDVAPTGTPYTGSGFLKLLDQDLVNVLGAVNKQVAKATLDGGGQDTFSDKVFLLSKKEIYGIEEGVVTGEVAYPYYSQMAASATDADVPWRIKYLAGTANKWRLRSAFISNSSLSRTISAPGGLISEFANTSNGISPAFVIV